MYEAIDERLGNTVAVKETHFTDAGLRKQFKREAQLLATLRHPALPRVIDHFDEADGLYLVMDFIPGDDLWTELQQRNGPFAVEEVRHWADQILDALSYLHAQKPPVVHRDIKLQNLKLTDEGRIILLDFGLAKGLAESSAALTTRTVLGFSLPYAPLEQILQIDVTWQEHLSVTHPQEVERLRKCGTDHRSDLYSAGATLLHLLTNKVPPHAPMRAISVWSGHADPLQNTLTGLVPEDFWKTLRGAMALEPEQRFASAIAMRESLQQREIATDRSATLRVLPDTLVDQVPPTQVSPTDSHTQTTHKTESKTIATVPAPLPPTPAHPVEISQLTSPPVPGNASAKKILLALGGFVVVVLIGLVMFRAIRGLLPRSSNTTPATITNANKSSPRNAAGISPAPAKWGFKKSIISGSLSVTRFSPDGKYLAIAEDSGILLWDPWTETDHVILKHRDIESIDYTSDGKWLVAASSDTTVRVWEVETGALKSQLKAGPQTVNAAVITPDGATVVFADTYVRTLSFWDLKSGQRRESQEEAGNSIEGLAIAPDGKITASTSYWSNEVKLWSVQTGALIRTLSGHSDRPESVVFSPDGKTLASGGDDGTIKLWDVATGNLKQTFKNGERVKALVFHPDGKIIAAAGLDKFNVNIWDLQSGTLRQTLTGHTDLVWAVSFSPDGRLLASGSFDHTVKIWQGVE